MSVQSITVFRAEGPKNYKEQESLLGTQPSGYNRLRVLYVRCFDHLYISVTETRHTLLHYDSLGIYAEIQITFGTV